MVLHGGTTRLRAFALFPTLPHSRSLRSSVSWLLVIAQRQHAADAALWPLLSLSLSRRSLTYCFAPPSAPPHFVAPLPTAPGDDWWLPGFVRTNASIRSEPHRHVLPSTTPRARRPNTCPFQVRAHTSAPGAVGVGLSVWHERRENIFIGLLRGGCGRCMETVASGFEWSE